MNVGQFETSIKFIEDVQVAISLLLHVQDHARVGVAYIFAGIRVKAARSGCAAGTVAIVYRPHNLAAVFDILGFLGDVATKRPISPHIAVD